MALKLSKVWSVVRWILFLPAALASFFLVFAIVDSLLPFNTVIVILAGTLATAGSVFLSKVVAPSSRVAISMTALATLVICLFYLDKHGAAQFTIVGWPFGLALGFFVSTRKGPERSAVLRSLRWTLFLPVAAAAGLVTAILLSKFVRLDQMRAEYLAIALGNAVFVGIGGLLTPSHRTAVILLTAPISYLTVYFGFWKDYQSLTTGIGFFIAWALGIVVGLFIARRKVSDFKIPLGAEVDSGEKKRRYKGTAPYQDLELDRNTFFGRDHESRSLFSLVMAERLVVLFAKSGMGKSSLINAGLVEPLRKQGFFPIVVRLNDQVHGPMDSLLAGVRQAAEKARVDVLGSEATSAWGLFKTAEFWSESNDLLRPVLILDQFEEIFTLHSPAVRHDFIGQLGELVRGRSETRHAEEYSTTAGEALDDASPPQLKVVIALREDFLANLEELAREIPGILHNRFRLGPLSRETAREAIIGPARLADDIFRTDRFTYKEEAVQRMIDFLAKRQFGAETTESDEVEPVQLQLICDYLEEMVRHRQAAAKKDSEIEISEADLGGEMQMRQVMEGFYDRTIAALTPRRKGRAVQHLCEKRLVSSSGRRLTEDQDEIKRRFRLSDKVLRQLVDARLLRAESRLGGTFYEVSHDRLVEPILKSRKKRLAKQWWVAAAAIPLLLTSFISAGSQFIAHREQKALLERHKLGTLDSNSENAIQAVANLTKFGPKYEPKQLLTEIQKTSVLNPASLVILVMLNRGGPDQFQNLSRQVSANKRTWTLTDEERENILRHIKKHYNEFLESDHNAGVPTFLGALLFILDELEGSFDGNKLNEDVLKLKMEVLKKYKDIYFRRDQDFADEKAEKMASGEKPTPYVTNQAYQKFFRHHKYSREDRTEAVKVNWFEAFAYATCMNKVLPNRKVVKDYGSDIALDYADILYRYRGPLFWDRGLGIFLERLLNNKGLRIYLPS